MKDTLIKFETAKLAKEKGYNVYSKSYYNGKNLHTNGEILTTALNLNSENINVPSQTLLKKWIDENHNLFIDISPSDSQGYVFRITTGDDHLRLGGDGNYKTYEEALEKALVVALELIGKYI